jgi:hypothetical protein
VCSLPKKNARFANEGSVVIIVRKIAELRNLIKIIRRKSALDRREHSFNIDYDSDTECRSF